MIPDFDFGGTHKTFTIKGKKFSAFMNCDFTLAFIDENNQILTTLPKTVDKTIQDEFKTITKEIQAIFENQHLRMELYMAGQRRWTNKHWQTLFMNHPLLYPYATSLIWGIYDEKNNLKTSFFFNNEDFLNINGEKINVNSNSSEGSPIELTECIGIVHPMELTTEEKTYWQEVFEGYNITSPFNQLVRETISLNPKDKNKKMYTEIKGKIEMYAFRDAIEKKGWLRGSIRNESTIVSYYKPLISVGIDVFMNIRGMFIEDYNYGGVTLEAIYFVKHASVNTKRYNYNEPFEEKDSRLIAFGEVSPIIFSEVMVDIEYLKSLV